MLEIHVAERFAYQSVTSSTHTDFSNDFESYSVKLDSFNKLMFNCWVKKTHKGMYNNYQEWG